jgi:hypothetical protein
MNSYYDITLWDYFNPIDIDPIQATDTYDLYVQIQESLRKTYGDDDGIRRALSYLFKPNHESVIDMINHTIEYKMYDPLDE